MYACDICGKEFNTSQGLGGHRVLCGYKSLVPRAEGSGLRAREGSKQLQLRAEGSGLRAQGSLTKSQPRVLAEAESVALRTDKTGYISRSRSRANSSALQNVQWGKLIASVGIGVLVIWLVYKSLESWEWKGAGKKQVSPYKLIGGLVAGLG